MQHTYYTDNDMALYDKHVNILSIHYHADHWVMIIMETGTKNSINAALSYYVMLLYRQNATGSMRNKNTASKCIVPC